MRFLKGMAAVLVLTAAPTLAAGEPRAGLALVGAGAIIAIVVVAAGAGSSSGDAQPNSQSVTTTP
jgi:hypothetical protein